MVLQWKMIDIIKQNINVQIITHLRKKKKKLYQIKHCRFNGTKIEYKVSWGAKMIKRNK